MKTDCTMVDNIRELDRAIELLTKNKLSQEISFQTYVRITKSLLLDLKQLVARKSLIYAPELASHNFEIDATFLYYFNPLDDNLIYDASLYLSLLKPYIQLLNNKLPLAQRTVRSKYSVNDSNEPLDISYIDTAVRKCLRVAMLRKYLVSREEKFAECDHAYIQNLALISTELFNWDNPGSYDLLVEGSEFFMIAEMLGDIFVVLFSYSFIRNPLYQKAYRLFRDKIESLSRISHYSDLNAAMVEIDIAAEELVHFIDQYLISSPKDSPTPIPSLWLNSNNCVLSGRLFKNIPFDSTQVFSEMELENVLGFTVAYKYLPPVVNLNSFNRFVRIDKTHINRLYETLQLIKAQHLSHQIKSFEQTGAIDVENFYRRHSDCLVFEEDITRVSFRSKFNILYLLDNSCSINDNKKRTMQLIMSLMLLTIKDFPEIFSHLIAYAQNTEGYKVVAIRKLLDCKVEDVKSIEKVMHIHSSGINHDIFALHKVLKLHAKTLFRTKSTKTIAILIGDAWPISVDGDVLEEQKLLIQTIRHDYKDLIIIYIAVDANRHPRDLSYDYYISQKSGEFSMNVFLDQFSPVIKEIIKLYNKS